MSTTTQCAPTHDNHGKVRRIAAIGTVTLAVLSAAGVAAHRTDPTATLTGQVESVGRVEGADALVAVVADGRTVTAVVGSPTSATAERFIGDLAGGAARMWVADGASMVVRVAGTGARGVVTAPDGTTATFTTTATTGDAGLYRAAGRTVVGAYDATWVVLGDGMQAGTLREGSSSMRAGTLVVRHAVHLGGKASGERPPASVGEADLSGIGRVDAIRVAPTSLRRD